jgi:putative FmdB family regulatory protein
MPLVEYACQKCENLFEVLQGVTSEAEDLICPDCGSRNVERVLSTFAAKIAPSRGSAPAPSPAAGRCGGGCACHN